MLNSSAILSRSAVGSFDFNRLSISLWASVCFTGVDNSDMVTFKDYVGERVINILPDNVNPFAANRGKNGRGAY